MSPDPRQHELRGDVLALRWKNVDLERGTLRVVESLAQTKTGIHFKAPKTDRTRAITFRAYAMNTWRALNVSRPK